MFSGPLSDSIIQRASEKNVLQFEYIQIRDFGIGKHKMVDDKPYGGGVGMLLRVDVVEQAIEKAKCVKTKEKCKEKIILLDPRGEKFHQKKARTLANYDHLILVCAHYEGVDQRIEKYIDDSISIGDYILTGGEIPAMVVIDAVARLVPGVLGKEASNVSESFEDALLEYPQYTRPPVYKNQKVPQILVSGDHKKVESWKKEQALTTTKKLRPDLLKS